MLLTLHGSGYRSIAWFADCPVYPPYPKRSTPQRPATRWR